VIQKNLDKEYAPIQGNADFCKGAINLALGENNQYSGHGLVRENVRFKQPLNHLRMCANYWRPTLIWIRTPRFKPSVELVPFASEVLSWRGGSQGTKSSTYVNCNLYFVVLFSNGSYIYCHKVPTPTWGNHIPLFKHSGLEVKHYTYYDPKTCGFDFNGLVEDVKKVRIRKIKYFRKARDQTISLLKLPVYVNIATSRK